MRVHVITIGDEILIGQIIDTNSAWIGQQLNLIGAEVREIQSVADDRNDIVAALRRAGQLADVVLITGGLGPTKDDITKTAIAEYYQVEHIFSSSMYDQIVRFFERLGRTTTEAHRQQCFVPQNATLLKNKMGTAPGMWFDENDTVIVSMPGVPYEMKYLMEYEVLPRLKDRFPAQPIYHRTILTAGEGESRIAERIAQFSEHLPDNLKLAFLPNLGQVRLRLTGRGSSEPALVQTITEKVSELTALLPDLVFGFDTQTLEEVVGELLVARGQTVVTAESCTGGKIAQRITAIPGASRYFKGSIIAYDNKVKTDLLRVPPQTLQLHGAVSEECVEAMVLGATSALNADYAVATSGIAGPGGGTREKPVGTIWIAAGNADRVVTQKLSLGKRRTQNIEYTSTAALNLLRKTILQME